MSEVHLPLQELSDVTIFGTISQTNLIRGKNCLHFLVFFLHFFAAIFCLYQSNILNFQDYLYFWPISAVSSFMNQH